MVVLAVVVAVVVVVRGHAPIIAAARTASGTAGAAAGRTGAESRGRRSAPCALGNAPGRRAGRSPVCRVGAAARTRGPTMAGPAFGRGTFRDALDPVLRRAPARPAPRPARPRRAAAAARRPRARHRAPARPRAVGPGDVVARRRRDPGAARRVGLRPAACHAPDPGRPRRVDRRGRARLRRRLPRAARRELGAGLARPHRRRVRGGRACCSSRPPSRQPSRHAARPGGARSRGAPCTAPPGRPAPSSSRTPPSSRSRRGT